MKRNIIYVNFSYEYKKKKIKLFLQNLFRKKINKPSPSISQRDVIKIKDFKAKHIL